MDENISAVENPIFAMLTKNTSLQHCVRIAMIQRVFVHALFSRLKLKGLGTGSSMHCDIILGAYLRSTHHEIEYKSALE